MTFVIRPDYSVTRSEYSVRGNRILTRCNQSVVVAFQGSQYATSYAVGPSAKFSALESNFIEYFGVIMNGALVPVIVRLKPIVRSAFIHIADVLGYLSHHYHSPRRI